MRHDLACVVSGGVALVTLERPGLQNALTRRTAEQLVSALEAWGESSEVHAVVITGSAGVFCAGGEMSLALWRSLRLLPKPVVAAVNGLASGAGFSLAAACDLRLAGESARFRQAFTTKGLTPDVSWAALVPLLVGLGRANELLLSDPVLTAGQALGMGLVNRVVPDDQLIPTALEWSTLLMRGRGRAFAQTKTLIGRSLLAFMGLPSVASQGAAEPDLSFPPALPPSDVLTVSGS